MSAVTRPQKITLAEMRASGVRGLLVCCGDYHLRIVSGPCTQFLQSVTFRNVQKCEKCLRHRAKLNSSNESF